MKKLFIVAILQFICLPSLHAMLGEPAEDIHRPFRQEQARARAEILREYKQQLQGAALMGSLKGSMQGAQHVSAEEYIAQNTSYDTSIKLGSHNGFKQAATAITSDILVGGYKDIRAMVDSKEALEKDTEENLQKQKFVDSIVNRISINEALAKLAQTYSETEHGKNNPELKAIAEQADAHNIQLLIEAHKKINQEPSKFEKYTRVVMPPATFFAFGALGFFIVKIATAAPAA